MKKKHDDYKVISDNKLKAFADEYLTTKSVLWGLGIASLAGVATYSAIRALKNEELVNRINRIKSELNFDNLKSKVSSKFSSPGFGSMSKQPVKPAGRGPVKPGKGTKAKSKRYVTG